MKCCPMCSWGVVPFGPIAHNFPDWVDDVMERLYSSHVETHVEDFRIELGLMTPSA